MVRHPRYLVRDLVILMLIVVAIGADSVMGQSIELYDRALAAGPDVTLQEVAALEGSAASTLGELIVGRMSPGVDHMFVTLPALRKVLGEQGINLAPLLLRGYVRCKVSRSTAPPPKLGPAEHAAPLVANSIDEFAVHATHTLGDLLMRWLEQHSEVPVQELTVKLSERDTRLLSVPAQRDRYEFVPVGSARLGKMAINISQYRQDALVHSFHVRPTVTRQVLAVVARTRIKAGQPLMRGDLEVRPITLDRVRGAPVTQLNDALGMVNRSTLNAGSVLFVRDLRMPVVVRRGELITVRCHSGALVIKTIGRAQSDGAIDDVIDVRNERAHGQLRGRGHRGSGSGYVIYPVRITGHGQAVTVGSPVAPPQRLTWHGKDES